MSLEALEVAIGLRVQLAVAAVTFTGALRIGDNVTDGVASAIGHAEVGGYSENAGFFMNSWRWEWT